jgi:hypothetical protein
METKETIKVSKVLQLFNISLLRQISLYYFYKKIKGEHTTLSEGISQLFGI